jgi:hypothetical protein
LKWLAKKSSLDPEGDGELLKVFHVEKNDHNPSKPTLVATRQVDCRG